MFRQVVDKDQLRKKKQKDTTSGKNLKVNKALKVKRTTEEKSRDDAVKFFEELEKERKKFD